MKRYLRRLGRAMLGDTPTPAPPAPLAPPTVPMNLNKTSRLLYLKRLLDMVADKDGDIVECGIGHGDTFLMLQILTYDEGRNRRMWGFDSFQGFPDSPEIQHRPQTARWQGPTLRKLYDKLEAGGIPGERLQTQTTVIEGFFADSLVKYTGDKIALLHLDVDLGESYTTCLTQLYDKVIPGGVIAFDEYMGTWEHHNFPQAAPAIDAFLKRKGLTLCRDARFGKYYTVKKPNQTGLR